jgi:mitochondrial distribution and morphology protein 31
MPTKKHIHQSGDFDIKECIVQDMFVTVWNPNFRPFTVTIFNGHCTPLRKQWLLYDLLAANSITGIFDDSLFSIHTSDHGSSSEEICRSVSELQDQG